MQKKIKIGYTLGDLAGIGPEIFSKYQKHYFKQSELQEKFDLVLVDDQNEVAKINKEISYGKAHALCGEHAFQSLVKADQMLKAGEIKYLVTGPVAKESLWLAGIQKSGQTEVLAHINKLNRDQIEMFFVYGSLKIVLATRHVPLKEVGEIYKQRFDAMLANSTKALKDIFNINNAKIAVAGINPHAGENGIFGLEEKYFLEQKIKDLKAQGVDITAPISADYLFAQMIQNYLHNDAHSKGYPYDLYIAAYHDQALPCIKGIGGLSAINLTAGLPYIRVSVDHGVGFDIAGKNIAEFEGFKACTDFCLELEQSQQKSQKVEKYI